MVEETVSKDILDKLNAGIEITGTNVDIRDLTHASDSVEVYHHKVATMTHGAVSVTGAVTTILSAQATRTGLIIVNNSDQTVFLGGDAVSVVNGLPLEVGASYSNQDWVGAIYGIVAAGTADVRVEDFY